MIQIAICDDNFMDQLVLKHLLEKQIKDRHMECLIESYPNGQALLDNYKRGKYDIIFLNVCMKKMSGIEVGRIIRENDYKIELVYVSSETEHILESFEVFAMGYLLKPFDVAKIDIFFNYYFSKHPNPKTKLIKVKYKNLEYNIFYSNIIYVDSCDKTVSFYTTNQGIISINDQLNRIEKLLDDERFLRCHQSYIVNMDYVIKNQKDDFVLENEMMIPIRKKEKRALITTYLEYVELKI